MLSVAPRWTGGHMGMIRITKKMKTLEIHLPQLRKAIISVVCVIWSPPSHCLVNSNQLSNCHSIGPFRIYKFRVYCGHLRFSAFLSTSPSRVSVDGTLHTFQKRVWSESSNFLGFFHPLELQSHVFAIKKHVEPFWVIHCLYHKVIWHRKYVI